jgi:hypothetical protein
MGKSVRTCAVVVLALGVLAAGRTPAVLAQAKGLPMPQGKSPAVAKELTGLLDAKKLTGYAVADSANPGAYVALLYTPNVQLIVAAGTHDQPLNMDYYIYNKDYVTAYQEMYASILVKNRFVAEDFGGNGLLAVPPSGSAPDLVTMPAGKYTFDGDVSDPKRPNPKKISLADYTKNFTAADDRYTQVLTTLVDALKKAAVSPEVR